MIFITTLLLSLVVFAIIAFPLGIIMMPFAGLLGIDLSEIGGSFDISFFNNMLGTEFTLEEILEMLDDSGLPQFIIDMIQNMLTE